ncbi:MAG TPA: hypothetical protein PKE58_22585 [Acidobacteriota bacterium]|nr:hypothetical protein [Acidobacteriota bacterium]
MKIAFLAKQNHPHPRQKKTDTQEDLWVMDADGRHRHLIASHLGWGTPQWSPDGNQILVHLTQGEESGLHFLNIHDGIKRRFTGHYAFTATWSPDGEQIAFSSSFNDETDIHLYSVQTGVQEQITFDQRSHCPAWQPLAIPAPVTPVAELTFHWSKLVYERQAMAKKQSTSNPNFVVRWAQFLADPETKPPFQIRLGIQSTGASGVKVLMDGVVFDCENIPDGVQKLQAVIKLLNFPVSDDFMLVYPRYAVEEPSTEQTLHLISGLIFDAAQAQGWGFDRELPEPVWPDA